MERLERNHVHEWEKLLHIRFPACSQEVGRRIHSSTSVFDLDGVVREREQANPSSAKIRFASSLSVVVFLIFVSAQTR